MCPFFQPADDLAFGCRVLSEARSLEQLELDRLGKGGFTPVRGQVFLNPEPYLTCCDVSLGLIREIERFELDYVDVLYCHRPDKTTPIEETVWAMHNIIEWGKAMYWGTSMWSAAEIVEAIQIAERHHLHKPVVEQPEYNLFECKHFSGEYARFYKDYGYGTTTFSPLMSGLLSGKYNKGIPKDSRGGLKGYEWLRSHLTDKQKLARVQALEPIAKELKCTLSQMSIAWCLKNPFVSTVITGATRVEQVHENVEASEVVSKLTTEVMEKIDKVFGVTKEEEED